MSLTGSSWIGVCRIAGRATVMVTVASPMDEAEREKIEKGARRAGRIHRAHEAGRLDAFAVMRAMDELMERSYANVHRGVHHLSDDHAVCVGRRH